MAKTIKEKGSKVTVWAEFAGVDGSAVDPTSVTSSYRTPDGSSYSATATNPSVGRYEFVLELLQEGTYWWKFVGSTPPDAKVVIKGTVESESRVDF